MQNINILVKECQKEKKDSFEKLKVALISVYESYLTEFAFLAFTSKEFDENYNRALVDSIKKYNNENNFQDIFKKKLKSFTMLEIKRRIETGNLSDINNYIKFSFSKATSKDAAYKNLMKLVEFLDKYKIENLVDIINDLCAANELLDNSFQMIIGKYNKYSMNIPEAYQNDILYNMLMIYCSFHDIEIIEEIDDEEKSVSDVPDVVKQFFNNIAKYEILDIDEVKELMIRYSNGDKKARDLMITHNLKLVVSIAAKYTNRGLPIEDLIGYGTEGLMKAVDKYDYKKGYTFATYAIWWIRQSITRAISDYSDSIRKPAHFNEVYIKLKKAEELIYSKTGKKPTSKELAEELGIPVEKVDFLYASYTDTVSLQETVGEEEDGELGNFIKDEDVDVQKEAEDNVFANAISICLLSSGMKEIEKVILILRYGLDGKKNETLEEIGKRLNITRERVRQRESSALRRLKIDRLFSSMNSSTTYIGKPKEIKRLTEIFPSYGIEAIQYAIGLLSDDDKKFINTIFEDGKKCIRSLEDLSLDETHRLNDIYVSLFISMLKHYGKETKKGFQEKYKDFSEKEITSAMKKLSIEFVNALYIYYGLNLNIVSQDETLYEKYSVEDAEKELLSILKKQKNIYQFFSEYQKDMVMDKLYKLQTANLTFLQKIFGNNLEEYVVLDLQPSESATLYRIVDIVKSMLDKEIYIRKPVKEERTLFDYFEPYDFSDINVEISKLPEDEIELLKIVFGENLDKPAHLLTLSETNKTLFYNLIGTIRNNLKSLAVVELNKSINTLPELLKGYNDEEIHFGINCIDSERQQLIYAMFGFSLEKKVDFSTLSDTDKELLSNTIKLIKSLLSKKIIAEKNLKNLFDRLPDFNKDDIRTVVDCMADERKAFIIKIFGIDYMTKICYEELDRDEKLYLSNALAFIRNRIKSRNFSKVRTEVNESVYDYLKEFSEEEINEEIAKLTPSAKDVLILKFGVDFKTKTKYQLRYTESKRFYCVISQIRSRLKEKRRKDNEVQMEVEVKEQEKLKYLYLYEIANNFSLLYKVESLLSSEELGIMNLMVFSKKNAEEIAKFLGIDIVDVEMVLDKCNKLIEREISSDNYSDDGVLPTNVKD